MAFNGSGTYVPISPPDFPAVAGTTIRASQYNTQINDMAAALTQVVCKDGQTIPTANLPMAGFRHTGVGAATARTQYARAAEVQDGTLTWLTSVSGADTITALGALSVSAYVAGQRFAFKAVGANTGAVTLNINAIGAKAVVGLDGSALAAGEITNGGVCEVVYDGTNFQLLAKNWEIQLATKAELTTKASITSSTGSVVVPSGTTAQRDGSPAAGYLRFNSTLSQFEGYNGTDWEPVGTGAVFASNAQTQAGTATDLAVTPAGLAASMLGGVGQTWQDVKASRALSVEYTNTTGRPIQVAITTTNGTSTAGLRAIIGGVDFTCALGSAGNGAKSAIVTVPAGMTYQFTESNTPTVQHWVELR